MLHNRPRICFVLARFGLGPWTDMGMSYDNPTLEETAHLGKVKNAKMADWGKKLRVAFKIKHTTFSVLLTTVSICWLK